MTSRPQNRNEALEVIDSLLSEMRSITDVIADLAYEHGIDFVDFMGSMIKFGITRHSYKTGEDVFVPAVSGPIISNEYWNSSSFECWPSEEQRRWLYGADETTWPSSDDDYVP